MEQPRDNKDRQEGQAHEIAPDRHVHGKRAYHKPKIEEFGSVLELTAAAGTNAGDTNMALSVTAC